MMRTLFTCLLLLTASPSILTAQDAERDLEEMVRIISENVSNLRYTRDVSLVMRYLHPKADIQITRIDVDGKMRVENLTAKDLEEQLQDAIDTKGLVMSQRVPRINYVQAKDDKGVVSYALEYDDRIDGKLANVGRRLYTMVAQNFNGRWQVIHMTGVELVDKKAKAPCDCYFFEKGYYDGGELITAKIRIPGGDGYYVLADHFEFHTEDAGDQLIKVNNVFYRWYANGELWKVADDGSKSGKLEKKLGKGSDRYEVMLKIMEDEFYPDACTKVKKMN